MKNLLKIVISAIIVFGLFYTLFLRRSAPRATDPHGSNCTQEAILSHLSSAQADEIIRLALEKDNGTGIATAVVIDGEIVFAKSTGLAAQNIALETNSRMRTGSVAKLFTAVAAAKLTEMNLLNLDQPVSELVPELHNDVITIYHLGTHTSGIRHFNFQKMSEANNQVRYLSLTDALGIFATDPLLFEPGTNFHYSSYGFNLLGVVVERAYGATFEVALQDLIATPLGLSSLALDDVEAEIPCRSTFSTIAFGRERINAPTRDNSDLYPSGGLVISAKDLAVFVDAIFNGGFLKPETIEWLTTPVQSLENGPTNYAFAWQIGLANDGSVEWYGHGGQINGAFASVRYYPANKMTIVGMTNYNFWLTSNRPEFFNAVREELPTLFANH